MGKLLLKTVVNFSWGESLIKRYDKTFFTSEFDIVPRSCLLFHGGHISDRSNGEYNFEVLKNFVIKDMSMVFGSFVEAVDPNDGMFVLFLWQDNYLILTLHKDIVA